MGKLDLSGPIARLYRAKEHLESLKSQSATFLGSRPFLIESDFDPTSRDHILRFRIRGFIPVHLSLVVGDVIHNARSALDQLAWMLATREVDADSLWANKDARNICFPVVRTDLDDFQNHRSMPFYSEKVKELLKEVQPFVGGQLGRSIDRLDKYWNIDKHRTLHPGFARLSLHSVSFRMKTLIVDSDFPGDEEYLWSVLPTKIEDGTEIARVRYSSGGGPPQLQVEVVGQPEAELAFGNAEVGVEISHLDLRALLDDVEEVISKFGGLSDRSIKLAQRHS